MHAGSNSEFENTFTVAVYILFLFTHIAFVLFPSHYMFRRILALDTNEQTITGVTDVGYPISKWAIGQQYALFWPHQMQCLVDASPQSAGPHALPAVTVYVTEYLGNDKRLTLQHCTIASKSIDVLLNSIVPSLTNHLCVMFAAMFSFKVAFGSLHSNEILKLGTSYSGDFFC